MSDITSECIISGEGSILAEAEEAVEEQLGDLEGVLGDLLWNQVYLQVWPAEEVDAILVTSGQDHEGAWTLAQKYNVNPADHGISYEIRAGYELDGELPEEPVEDIPDTVDLLYTFRGYGDTVRKASSKVTSTKSRLQRALGIEFSEESSMRVIHVDLYLNDSIVPYTVNSIDVVNVAEHSGAVLRGTGETKDKALEQITQGFPEVEMEGLNVGYCVQKRYRLTGVPRDKAQTLIEKGAYVLNRETTE